MMQGFSIGSVRSAEEALRARLADEGEDDIVLMQRAAKGLAHVVAHRVSEDGLARVVALVGPGDNGGDALLAAARLARRGTPVTAVLATPSPHPAALKAARKAGVPLVWAAGETAPEGAGTTAAGPDLATALLAVSEADLVLDGLLGIGGRPGLGETFAELVDAIDPEAYVMAVDLPSGCDPNGLVATPEAVFADETIVPGCLKPVHLLPATEPALGTVTVLEIGLDVADVPAVERLTYDAAAEMWPVPGLTDDKYSRGVLGVVAGSDPYPGAAALVCSAAVETGAGMVRYIGPRRAGDLVVQHCPEAVLGAGQVQAWVVGPGLTGPDAMNLPQGEAARAALDSDLPVLLDAGGLELLDDPRVAPTLLTPHAGELARLLTRLTGQEVTRDEVIGAPVQLAQEAADRLHATVLLKGATSIVVSPASSMTPIRTQRDAPAWLATAGAGDTLAGIAGVLLAAGLHPSDAGALAALVHGVAADRANPGGPVRALHVGRAVPGVVAELLRR